MLNKNPNPFAYHTTSLCLHHNIHECSIKNPNPFAYSTTYTHKQNHKSFAYSTTLNQNPNPFVYSTTYMYRDWGNPSAPEREGEYPTSSTSL